MPIVAHQPRNFYCFGTGGRGCIRHKTVWEKGQKQKGKKKKIREGKGKESGREDVSSQLAVPV